MDLFDELYTRAINCCGPVTQNLNGMAGDIDSKILNLKWGDTHARERGIITAMIWKDK